jgi:two-component SAPR family response regulator
MAHRRLRQLARQCPQSRSKRPFASVREKLSESDGISTELAGRIKKVSGEVQVAISATKKVLHEAVDFAFLDVEVTNGKTFEVAQTLERKGVPFAFVSGSPQEELPSDLRSAPFIPKPFYPAQIERALQALS